MSKYDDDNRGQDICGECNIGKDVDAILEDIKNNGKIAKSISGRNINLHQLIIKLLKAEESVLKKDPGFGEVFNIFNEVATVC